jgi:hypothetical protein
MLGWFQKPVTTAPPGAVTRDVIEGRCHVQLDLTPQVLSLQIPHETTWLEGEEPLAPTSSQQSQGFISASMLAVKAKVFDDGLYAAVELAAQHTKQPLLASLVGVAPTLAAAARLGGTDTPLSSRAKAITDEFLADALASKPIGFYTWSDALRRIFQQDRILQRKLGESEALALKAALESLPAGKAAYEQYLALVAKLTNPLVDEKPDLRQADGAWFFPPSRSHETELVKRLYGERPIPNGFSLAEEMIKRLRDGSLNLDPTEASGWYDFQTWALEPLVLPDKTPEASRLRMNDRYRDQLDDLFKSILALTRETHVKQLEIPTCGCAGGGGDPKTFIAVRPELSVEPLLTYYERRADCYDFVRRLLESHEESLGSLRTMHRVTAAGPVSRSLDEELSEMTALFRGAAAVVGQELGMAVVAGPEATQFRKWAIAPDAAKDVRMMVPVFFDIARGRTKVWAILGWATRDLHVSFATTPEAHVLRGRAEVLFLSSDRRIAYPVFVETYVERLLDRDEFRAHCDRYQTRSRIVENL